MSSYSRVERWLAQASCLALIGAALTVAPDAHAYVVRETASSVPIHWPADDIAIELDPSLTDAFPDALDGAAMAALGWTDADCGPVLHVALAATSSAPAVDGRNVIYFAPDGYAPAGDALAVTLVSYDDTTGEIVDADIVINGRYRFAVLPESARAPAGTTPISNEPGAVSVGTTSVAPMPPFDLVHVLAHETGHVLGLGDTTTEAVDVMFLYSSPGDASRRAPTADDAAGVAFLYAADAASSGQSCAVHASPGRASGAPGFVLALCLSFALLRRRRGAGPERK